MDAPDDITLLRQYTEQNSEAAFATLVARHIDKVYSAAFRQTGDRHLAEELSQIVFVILARKAYQLGNQVVLAGWLQKTARLTAVTWIRSEIRRTRREQEAYMQTDRQPSDTDIWTQIAPLLDAAIADLSDADRNAIVLRYFDGRSMKEVATALHTSEDAVKMRVNRAIEKLRRFFRRRGVTLTAGVLTSAIASHSVQAAPAELTATATAAAVRNSPMTESSSTLVQSVLSTMTWKPLRVPLALAAAVVFLALAASLRHLHSLHDLLLDLHRRLIP